MHIRLRDQARIQRFRTKLSLLEAFRELKLRNYDFKNLNERNDKFNNNKINKETVTTKSETTTTKSDETTRVARTCYNCKKSGYISKNCRQRPKRQTMDPNKEKGSPEQNSAMKRATVETTTNIIQFMLVNPPFVIEIKYLESDNYNNTYDYKIMAMIDSGSPVV